MTTYQEIKTFDERKSEATKIISRYPSRIPVIVERASSEKNLPLINKNKYLVPMEMSMGNLLVIIRKRLKLTPEKALFVFVNSRHMVPTSSIMSDIYDQYSTLDKYLYLQYCSENTFG